MEIKLQRDYKVQFSDIDFLGKITLKSIAGYMQAVASDHAESCGFNWYKEGGQDEMPPYYWIVSRVKYMMDEYSHLDEVIRYTTYPGGYDKLFAVRLFELKDGKGKDIGRIIGDYILMDTAKNRPAIIRNASAPFDILNFPYEGEKLDKLKVPEDYDEQDIRKCRFSEIDLNGHMNNGHYVTWIMDMFSLEFLEKHEVSSLQINYTTSICYNDVVNIRLKKHATGEISVWGISKDEKTVYFIAQLVFRTIKEEKEDDK